MLAIEIDVDVGLVRRTGVSASRDEKCSYGWSYQSLLKQVGEAFRADD
jgi:hypothetical protein